MQMTRETPPQKPTRSPEKTNQTMLTSRRNVLDTKYQYFLTQVYTLSSGTTPVSTKTPPQVQAPPFSFPEQPTTARVCHGIK